MDSFDIQRLTDFDFEAVCKDIFEVKLALTLEIFTQGPDQGIDLRYVAETGKSDLIIQCKHWARHKRAALIRYMEEKELPKINSLKPSRYVLATSVALSRQAKDTLCSKLKPYILTPGDIYGVQEIESFLRTRPDIVQRHLRLWLASTSVLQAILNKNILSRSSDLSSDIKSAMLVYVPNSSFARAREILDAKRVCVIAGIPGIGKTVLAQVLTAAYSREGYNIYEISVDADEINKLWDDEIPQVFYYDDFLGQNVFGDKFNKNEDARLIRIMCRVASAHNKRLIMTTREYILEQAKQNYEKLGRVDFDVLQCTISLEGYTKLIRAEILYNHVYFSDISPDEKAAFANPDTYEPIINHPNFNPRLIGYSLRLEGSHRTTGETVATGIKKNLDNPRRIWQHIVENQLPPQAVAILVVILSFSSSASVSELESAVRRYSEETGDKLTRAQFRRALKVLEDTMIRVTSNGEQPVVDYHNPSIRDYMYHHVESIDGLFADLLRCAIKFEQVETLWNGARWSVTRDIYQQLLASKDELVTAIERTYEGEDIFHRSLVLLEIAQELDAPEIELAIAPKLTAMKFSGEDFDYIEINDIAPMVDRLWAARCPTIISGRERIRNDAVSYLLADISDWPNASLADSVLAQMGDLAPEAAVSEVDERLTELAQQTIDQIVSDGTVASHQLSSVREQLDYARTQIYPESMFPGYGEAAEILSFVMESAEDIGLSVHEPIDNGGMDDDQVVSVMFGSLGDDDRS